jgi:hypothetical protein
LVAGRIGGSLSGCNRNLHVARLEKRGDHQAERSDEKSYGRDGENNSRT